MTDFTKELAAARAAVSQAMAAILRHYASEDIEVTHKSPGQPVTEADREANRAVKAVLREAFPGDGWLSEEDTDDAERLGNSRVWVVDPLDGTGDFIRRIPEFAVSVALVVDGEPVVGAIGNPAKGETFWAAKGAGAFDDRGLIRVSNGVGTGPLRLIVSRSEHRRGEWEEFKTDFAVTPTGGTAYKMALVARGDADGCFTLQPKNEWDICAGHVIVVEAGGVVTRLDGSPVVYNRANPRLDGLIYCTPSAHGRILERIRAKRLLTTG